MRRLTLIDVLTAVFGAWVLYEVWPRRVPPGPALRNPFGYDQPELRDAWDLGLGRGFRRAYGDRS